MIRRAAQRVSARPAIPARLLAVLAAFLLLAVPALAGDRALIDFIGYSRDRDHFAFEEYGVQDGSGFAYSAIYIVQLSNDSWVKGTPYRAQASEDRPDTPLAEVRAQAREMARPDIEALDIAEPAQILALIGDGAVGEDGKSLAFADPICCGVAEVSEDVQTLKLETFSSATAFDCEGMLGQKGLGYALSLTAKGQTREVHRDKGQLPKSRGCPLDYRLYGVVSGFDSGAGHVAIIASFPFGFEGPDRRFLAVPLGN